MAIDDIRRRNEGRGRFGTLQKLLRVEEAAIEVVIKAGIASARFERLKSGDSAVALEALSAFGVKLTEAFNEQLGEGVWKEALPILSTELFMAAARGFDTSLVTRPQAVLELFIMKEDAPLPPEDLGALGGEKTRKQVVLQQRLAS